ncbi:hypothetical protein [Clostridium lacusfryxellense]|uniref:hypothetical protein n=1 Tax=Clostridium lacusfryxellense TaxID=205328 RepID=UPI001C0DCEF2|nr:hypothetical protein [Clostridium lacusfryxellense]MBU3114276.1 hypothetical protein [Clostridium lacusfryxellense]
MKELSNDNFFIKWKPTHEKGIFAYEIRNTVPLIIFLIFINIIYLIKYPSNTEAFKISAESSVVMALIFIAISVLKWLNSEKRYKYIEKVYEENKKEI